MSRIDILLSTYNGEKYLDELFNSIIDQTYINWHLIIRDDGSIDSTQIIIDKFKVKYPGKISQIESKQNVGVIKSFEILMQHTVSDYIMFCDQDDVWLPTKIELTYEKITQFEKEYPNKPILIHSDLMVVDKYLNVISNSFWYYSRIRPELLVDFNYLAVKNAVTGCTAMINSKVKNIIPKSTQNTLMHDSWITLNIANELGVIAYIDIPTILYRQHDNNVLGANNNIDSYYKKKILDIKKVIKLNINQFKMVNEIVHFSIMKYIYFKIKYLIKSHY